VSVLPKSETPSRMLSNITLVKLTDEEMAAIGNIHKKPGLHRSLLVHFMQDGKYFGWTPEQLGWDMNGEGIVPEKA
jgi:glycerol 2-dehydrogenase (NADP+)